MKKTILIFLSLAVLQIPSLFGGLGIGKSQVGFLTSLPPEAPEPKVPENGATGVQDSSDLQWLLLPHAATYHLQVASTLDFNDPVIEAQSITDTSYTITGLTTEAAYFWQLQASNVAGDGPLSSVWIFTTAKAAPAAPDVVSPLNGATDVPVSAELRWNAVPETDTYILQISRLPDFSTLFLEETDITGTWFQTGTLQQGTLYFWRVAAVNEGGAGPYSTVWMFTTQAGSSVDGTTPQIPKEFVLWPACPNPFNPVVTVAFDLPESGEVSVTVYNEMGQQVIDLVHGTRQAGRYRVRWNGTDRNGIAIPSGIYICRMRAGKHVFSQKMLLAR